MSSIYYDEREYKITTYKDAIQVLGELERKIYSKKRSSIAVINFEF